MAKNASNRSSTIPKEFTSGFKFPKTFKRMMALQYTDAHLAGDFKRVMIGAQLSFLANKKKKQVPAGSPTSD